MSVVRLLISGLLVASGLVLAAFTLHGAFDGGQVQASGGAALQPWSTNTFGAGGRLAAPGSEGGKAPPPQTVPKPDAKAPSAAAADAKAVKKKRPPEQAQKSKQSPQQAAFQWPWSGWFGN